MGHGNPVPVIALLNYCSGLRHLVSFVNVMEACWEANNVNQMLSKNLDISGHASAELALGEDARKIHFPS